MNDLDQLVGAAQADFAAAATPAELENAKARYLGKAGQVTELLKGMGALSHEEKKTRGAEINQTKQRIESLLTERRQALAEAELQAQLKAESLDVSLPGRQHGMGGLHPVSRTMERIEAIFGSMGFEVADGPEIEEDWFNFTALNTPADHPARSMHDTFYVDTKAPDGSAHRLHTHATPTPVCHQCEGLWIGENVSFKDLKAVFADFFRNFFETDDLEIRFRPSFFPFTEPSAEVDIAFASGPLKGRWLEVAGSGQVHPSVVRNCGLDPERYIGFAFGMGPDRLTMLRYGVNDLRLFFDGDLRFLSQFK